MDDITQRLEQAIKRRDVLSAEVQRILGRKEAAQQSLEEVEAEIRAKKIDPDKIDVAIEKLATRYQKTVDEIVAELNDAEESLAPFLKE